MQSLRRFGDGFALIVSSVLFSLVHVIPLRMPNAFIMGLVMGYFVLLTGSVYTSIIIHLVHNVILMAISRMTWLSDSALNLVWLCLEVIYLVFGLIALFVLIKNYKGLFALAPSGTINTPGQKLTSFFLTAPFIIFALIILYLAGNYLI
jgi:hypothetical protein